MSRSVAAVIDVRGLTKRYGEKVAVDDLSFQVKPGIVTGFLGPNGAGKSTTMRMILGLDAPTAGTATVDGKDYRDLGAPLREVGAMLEARAIHTGRSAYNHLLAMAQTHGIPRARVDEVIELVGLQDVARKRVGDVLARHGPAPGHRRGAARRPAHRSCSTSRPTAWTPRASSGSATCSRAWPPRAARSSSPRT